MRAHHASRVAALLLSVLSHLTASGVALAERCPDYATSAGDEEIPNFCGTADADRIDGDFGYWLWPGWRDFGAWDECLNVNSLYGRFVNSAFVLLRPGSDAGVV